MPEHERAQKAIPKVKDSESDKAGAKHARRDVGEHVVPLELSEDQHPVFT